METDEIPESVIEDLRKDLRKELSRRMAGWAVAGGAGLVTLAALGAWSLLKPTIASQLGVVPLQKIEALVTSATSEIPSLQEQLEALPDVQNATSSPSAADIAEELAKTHTDALRGKAGANGQDAKITAEHIRLIASQLAKQYSKELKGEPGSDANLPNGSVLISAISCASLGTDWSPLKEATGRFVVGAGEETLRAYRMWRPENSSVDQVLPTYDVLSIGGEVEHSLTVAEMPSHAHGYGDYNPQGSGTVNNYDIGNSRSNIQNLNSPRATETSGSSEPHNNMPPYIALYFCKKGRS